MHAVSPPGGYRPTERARATWVEQRFPRPLGVASRGSIAEIEEGLVLMLAFDADGLVPVVVQDRGSREVLMLGWTDRHALRHTIETGYAHFFSRSRRKIWRKGESSGRTLRVRRIRVDDDQDCLLFEVGPTRGAVCHVGDRSCFHRALEWRAPFTEGRLRFLETAGVFDRAASAPPQG